MKKLTKKYIGFECTPSRWITKEPSYEKVTQLTLSYGGGMGGTKETRYVKRVKEIIPNKMMTFIGLKGKEITINTNYIVKAENYTVVSAQHKTTNSHSKPIVTINKLIDDKYIGKIKLADTYNEYIADYDWND